jgi:hypothetical protein
MKPTLYDEKLAEPPPADRLRAMISALASGAAIDAALRTEIIDALKRHEVRQANDRLRKRGRGIEHQRWFAAEITKQLLDSGAARSVKAAAYAAAESSRWMKGQDPRTVTSNEVAAITRDYQKLAKSPDGYISTNDGGKFTVALISPLWLADAAARLEGIADPGISNADAHGVIALLFDPIK